MLISNLLKQDWKKLWNGKEDTTEVGVIFTKPEVISLILDLAGYIPSKARLSELRVLEPSCGDGAFLLAIVERLFQSEIIHNTKINWTNPNLKQALHACDLSASAVESARKLIQKTLEKLGCPSKTAKALTQTWIIQSDFLLYEHTHKFDLVTGNPPYVRIEDLPRPVLNEYRSRFSTLTDRADIYVAFIQRGLELINQRGTLAYICANRFTKNKYGQSIRKVISDNYHVRYYINLEHTQPFQTKVSAYPGIFIIDRAKDKPTKTATLHNIDTSALNQLATNSRTSQKKSMLSDFDTWYPNGDSWITTDPDEYALLNHLDKNHPLLEQSAEATKIGIGVATGADQVFIVANTNTGIETSRLIPMAMASDIQNHGISWSGHYIINPFSDKATDNLLVDLDNYPGLKTYLEKNKDLLCRRHINKERKSSWYRTIDKIWPDLTHKQKLLIPDIQSGSVIGYDSGNFYPHHNLYWITSDGWPLQALQTILRSNLVRIQVAAYCVQMRGGSLRYQAQVLRRIRVPLFERIGSETVSRLIEAASTNSQEEVDAAAAKAFEEAADNTSKTPYHRSITTNRALKKRSNISDSSLRLPL